MRFTEDQLERAVVELLGEQGYPNVPGVTLVRTPPDVLIEKDLHEFLLRRYSPDEMSSIEIDRVIRSLSVLPASDLYDSNRAVMKWVSDGYPLKREDRSKKDLHLGLIDHDQPANNVFKLVSQLEIVGTETRIPDAVLYVNGLPLVLFEFNARAHSKRAYRMEDRGWSDAQGTSDRRRRRQRVTEALTLWLMVPAHVASVPGRVNPGRP